MVTNRQFGSSPQAFTLIEVLVVVVILGIAAVITVPMIADTADLQATSAARQIVSTLLFTQTACITKQETYQMVFDSVTDSYSVQDAGGNVIDDPVIAGKQMQLSYPDSSDLSHVTLNSADFNGTDRIWFNRLGEPYAGNPAGNNPMTSGTIVVQSGDKQITVTVEPVTGRVTLSE